MSDLARAPWKTASAWDVQPGRGGAPRNAVGVHLRLIDDVPLATLIARQGQADALAASVQQHFGCPLPPAGRASFGVRGDIVWTAPGQWLLIGNAVGLWKACADLAAVTDQSSSRAMIEVAGRGARDALAKGFAIDLHPTVFTTGATAVTAVGHMSVQIWQVDSAPRFVIAVPRSLAGSFWSWLEGACAADGYEVAPSLAEGRPLTEAVRRAPTA